MDIQRIPFSKVNPAPYNPRVDLKPGDLEYEKLKKGMDEFGLVETLVWNKRTGNLVSGHQRMKILQDEWGWTEADFSVVDLDLEKEKALNIALNKIEGAWDNTKLKDLLEELDTGAFDVELTGFDLNELADLFGQVRRGRTGDDDIPPTPEVPTTQPGDIWVIGTHRLICGDSRDPDILEKLMAGDKAAMVFTDPPYNVNYGSSMKDSLRHKVSKENAGRKILNDNFESKEAFQAFLLQSMLSVKPHVQGDVYFCMSSSELDTLQSAFREAGGHFSTFIIWVKNTFMIGRSNYQRQYEPILYGWFEKTSHYWSGVRRLGDVIRTEDAFVDASGNVFLKAEDLSLDVWEFPKPTKSKEHPTMKPVALCERGVKNSCRVGDIVLDTFAGSGSTMIACEKQGRRCYMAELSQHYCDVIVQRWEDYTGLQAERFEAPQ